MTEAGAVPGQAIERYHDMLREVCATGRVLRRDERDALVDVGERSALAGAVMSDVAGVFLAETRRAWSALPGQAGASTGTEVRAVTAALLAALEATVASLAAGHERARQLVVRREEGERREFVDDLLSGRSDLGRLAERAERLGLYLTQRHVVAVARGDDPYDDVHPLVRQVQLDLRGRFGERGVLVSTKEALLVCVATEHDDEVVGRFAEAALRPAAAGGVPGARKVAIGRAHDGPGGVVRSYEEALRSLDLGDRLDLATPVLRAAELLVLPVLLRDRAAMADLVRTVLGPLTSARGGAGPLLRTLDVYFGSGCVRAEAARRLHVSVRTLTYRLERISRLTGYSLDDALQRYTLETAALGARMLGWPDDEP